MSSLQELITKYMILEIQFWSVNYRLVAGMFKKVIRQKQQNIIFQQYYQPYCDYLLKMGCMDEEQVLFEQSTWSNLKEWSSTALKAHSLVWENFWKPKSL